MIRIRRINGDSMKPFLQPSQIVIGRMFVRRPSVGKVVFFRHDGIEKIKRITDVRDGSVYVLGDNNTYSTDSRDFGWIDCECIEALLIWPRAERK
ncbi:hypothetical protein BH23PAT2_BH23PAT2_03940 [soil metagenome]